MRAMLRLLLVVLLSSLILSACGGDDSDPEAELCSDLQALQEAIDDLTASLQPLDSSTLDRLRDARENLSDAWDDVTDSAGEVTRIRIDDLRAAFDNLVDVVTNITDAADLNEAINSIDDAISGLTTAWDQLFTNLDCESGD